MIKIPKNNGIILFDGYCNLCSWSVRFILKRDNQDYFRFVALQSDVGKEILSDFEINKETDQSVILIENQSFYLKSDAALRIAKKLRHLWFLTYVFIIIPKFLRNMVYDFIAKNRFKWFGNKNVCFSPDINYSYKFL